MKTALRLALCLAAPLAMGCGCGPQIASRPAGALRVSGAPRCAPVAALRVAPAAAEAAPHVALHPRFALLAAPEERAPGTWWGDVERMQRRGLLVRELTRERIAFEIAARAGRLCGSVSKHAGRLVPS